MPNNQQVYVGQIGIVGPTSANLVRLWSALGLPIAITREAQQLVRGMRRFLTNGTSAFPFDLVNQAFDQEAAEERYFVIHPTVEYSVWREASEPSAGCKSRGIASVHLFTDLSDEILENLQLSFRVQSSIFSGGSVFYAEISGLTDPLTAAFKPIHPRVCRVVSELFGVEFPRNLSALQERVPVEAQGDVAERDLMPEFPPSSQSMLSLDETSVDEVTAAGDNDPEPEIPVREDYEVVQTEPLRWLRQGTQDGVVIRATKAPGSSESDDSG